MNELGSIGNFDLFVCLRQSQSVADTHFLKKSDGRGSLNEVLTSTSAAGSSRFQPFSGTGRSISSVGGSSSLGFARRNNKHAAAMRRASSEVNKLNDFRPLSAHRQSQNRSQNNSIAYSSHRNMTIWQPSAHSSVIYLEDSDEEDVISSTNKPRDNGKKSSSTELQKPRKKRMTRKKNERSLNGQIIDLCNSSDED